MQQHKGDLNGLDTLSHQTEIVAIIGGIVTIASIIVKLTPTPIDDKIFSKVYKVLEVLSLVKKK